MTGFSALQTPGLDSILESAIDEFRACRQRGENVQPDEFAARYPDVAPILLKLLSTCELLDLSQFQTVAMGHAGQESLRPLGDFRLIRELGRGGMGVVYEAEQISLGRRVALKILPVAAVLDERHLARFRTEALATACLKHSNIVTVYGVGCEHGIHYYSMEYVEGATLARVIAQLRSRRLPDDPLGPRSDPSSATSATSTAPSSCEDDRSVGNSTAEVDLDSFRGQRLFHMAATLGIQAAEGLAHAHEHGIIHRDVKPSNLLIHIDGKLLVTDFGLARIGAGADLTRTGDVVGTLRYMSPEQAFGVPTEVDHRSDIYALGATLFELLTLEPLVGASDRELLLRELAEGPNRRLRKLNPAVPADLEKIVLKAIATEKSDRYASARELADDLQRFVDQRPVLASLPTILDRARKWLRRNVSFVAAAVLVLMVLVTVLAISTWLIDRQRREAQRQQAIAQQTANELRRLLYATDMKLAFQSWEANDSARTLKLLGRYLPMAGNPDLRSFEWHYLWELCHAAHRWPLEHQGDVYRVAFSPDGTKLASHGEDSTVRVWDVATARTIRVHRDESGLSSFAFSPDGLWIATGGNRGVLSLWEVASGNLAKEVSAFDAQSGAVGVIAFSPDGQTIACGRESGAVRLCSLAEKGSIPLVGHNAHVHCIAFSPDGRTLATGSSDRTTRLWDVSDGHTRATLEGHTSQVNSLAFSHDGRTLATSSGDTTIKLWDVGSGNELATLVGHTAKVQRVSFSADDKRLASASVDTTIRIWDLATRQVADVLRGHAGRVWSVDFSPDGAHLASSSNEGAIWLWNASSTPGRTTPIASPRFVQSVTFSADGRLFACSGRIAYLLDLARKESRRLPIDEISSVAFTPDSRAVVFTWGQALILLEVPTLEVLCRFPNCHDRIASLAVAPNGQWLVTGGFDGWVKLWDRILATQRTSIQAIPSVVRTVAISPDSRLIAVGGRHGDPFLWEPDKGDKRTYLRGHLQGVNCAVFVPDGATLATASDDCTIRLWDVKSGESRAVLPGHAAAVQCLAITPDGRTLASGSTDHTIRLWNVDTNQEIAALSGHRMPILALAFSPDGRRLASGCVGNSPNEGELYIWNSVSDLAGSGK